MFKQNVLYIGVVISILFLICAVCESEDASQRWTPLKHAELINIHRPAEKYSESLQNTKHSESELDFLLQANIHTIARAEHLLADIEAANTSYYISEPCLNHTKIFLEGLSQRAPWAWQSKQIS